MSRQKAAQLARCTRPGISVQFAESGRRFAVDELVDLNAEAVPGLTWRSALGAYVEYFEPADQAPDSEGK